MARNKYSLTLSGIVLRCKNGTHDRLPWLETRCGDDGNQILPTEAARFANPSLPRRIRFFTGREVRLARRLRCRAYRQHVIDGSETVYWACRNRLWLSFAAIVGCTAVVIMACRLIAHEILKHPEVYALLPFSWWILNGIIMAFCLLFLIASPIFFLIQFRRHLIEDLTMRWIICFRTDGRGIQITRRNGEQSSHAWKDLKKVSFSCCLYFGGVTPAIIAVTPKEFWEFKTFLKTLKEVYLPDPPPSRHTKTFRNIRFFLYALLIGVFVWYAVRTQIIAPFNW